MHVIFTPNISDNIGGQSFTNVILLLKNYWFFFKMGRTPASASLDAHKLLLKSSVSKLLQSCLTNHQVKFTSVVV
jgi:hypothetical protein